MCAAALHAWGGGGTRCLGVCDPAIFAALTSSVLRRGPGCLPTLYVLSTLYAYTLHIQKERKMHTHYIYKKERKKANETQYEYTLYTSIHPQAYAISQQEVSAADLPEHVSKAFATCQCHGGQCVANADDRTSLLLVCHEGYVVVGGRWDGVVGAVVGGTCVQVTRPASVPVWGVALSVVVALVVGAAAAVFVVWVWEMRVLRVPIFEGKGLYQELSSTGGF